MKEPADRAGLLEWLRRELPGADYAVISVEMLLYGGLLPSRIHVDEADAVAARLDAFAELLRDLRSGGTSAPEVSLFGLIMRTPAYAGNEEEPDYYAEYGREIFLRGYLRDKAGKESLSAEERAQLDALGCVPDAVLRDYDRRRAANLSALMGVGRLLADGSVQRLVLPEDDTAEYGYGPREKRALMRHLVDLGVSERVLSYPGADEVGSMLVARAATAGHPPPKVYPLYSPSQAPTVVPRYESQPLGESVSAQIRAAGAVPADRPEEADIVLAVVAPAGAMTEAAEQHREETPVRRERYRRHLEFADKLARLWEAAPSEQTHAVADCVFANGADEQLVRAFRDRGLWSRIEAYAAWNTTGNTLGTVIARAVVEHAYPDAATRERNLVYRLLDDWAYQLHGRQVGRDLPAPGGEVESGNDHLAAVRPRIEAEMRSRWRDMFAGPEAPPDAGPEARPEARPEAEPAVEPARPIFPHHDTPFRSLSFPWRRLFEVEIDSG
jgi:hypothetical protein